MKLTKHYKSMAIMKGSKRSQHEHYFATLAVDNDAHKTDCSEIDWWQGTAEAAGNKGIS
jgi:hypothetical protein